MDTQRGHGVASRCLGGRDESVRPNVTTSSAATRRWVPPSSFRRDAITNEERYDEIFRGVRGILNKLAPEKFSKLSDELLNIGLESALVLKGVIILIFEKALEEPKYSTLYSQLCRKLCDHSPDFGPSSKAPGVGNSIFRSLLLKKCQDEFENRRKASESFDRKKVLSADEQEQRAIAKHKMLGNITFIGELGKQGLLPERIIHECIQTLLAKKSRSTTKDVAEDLECLCQIMKTVGIILDTNKAKALMDQYFERVESYASNQELPSRIRFMLRDIMELRRNKWIPRYVHSDNSPKTIRQIHEEAAKEYGFFIPSMQGNSNSMSELFSDGHNRMGLSANHKMNDFFDPFIPGCGNLGVGPGVITGDAFNGFNLNVGRNNRGGTGFTQNRQFNSYNRQQSTGSNGTQPSNQTQNFSNYSNKSLPPRFKKTQLSSGRNLDEISLRPAQNSIMLKPNSQISTSTMYPVQAQSNTGINDNDTLIGQSTMSNQSSVLIKQEKQKVNKPNITKEELLKKLETILSDYNAEQSSSSEVIVLLKEMKIPKKLYNIFAHQLMRNVCEKGEMEKFGNLLSELKKESFVTPQIFAETFKQLLNDMAELEDEVPKIKSHVAGIATHAVVNDICSLEDILELLTDGTYYPLFLLFLQQLHKLKGQEWLSEVFNSAKVNLLNLMPEADKTNERLLEVLDDRSLGFLLPLLKVQTDLKKRITDETNPTSLYTWIKESVDQSLQFSPKFVDTLMSGLIKHITMKSTLSKGVDPSIQPERPAVDKEKDLFMKYKPIFQAFLHEQMALQVITLYSLQVFCHLNMFPKGMLLRWFMMFYDFEVIEEESFLKWKEDVNDEYPGKGKALFQVNQWLTWLEEAEEEDDEEEMSDND